MGNTGSSGENLNSGSAHATFPVNLDLAELFGIYKRQQIYLDLKGSV